MHTKHSVTILVWLLVAASATAWARNTAGRNRGRYATLRGIHVGKTYPMVNPSTGRVVPRARVISTAVEPMNKVPYATLRFSNGYKEDVAAERLHLVGKSFSVQRRYMQWHKKEVVRAIERQLGLDAEKVSVRSLNGRPYMPRKRRRKKPAYLGPFLALYGDGLKPGDGLNGYEWDGRVVLSRNYAAFNYTSRTHEVLHALSEPFAQQAMDRGFTNLMEGINQYFTYKVVRPHFGIKVDPEHPYAEYQRFAAKVARKIGHDRLKRIVFASHGKKLLKKLAKKVDHAVGRRGAFYRACRALERDKPAKL